MDRLTLLVLVVGFVFGFVLMPARVRRARRGPGPRGQLAFRQANEARVLELLPPPRDATSMIDPPRSPWIHIGLDGRHARLVAAQLEPCVQQAGIELLDWELGEIQVWHARAAAGELELPDHVDAAAAQAIVDRLAALDVDSLAAARIGGPHLLRIRFSDVEQLARSLRDVAPLLVQLELLAQADEAARGAVD